MSREEGWARRTPRSARRPIPVSDYTNYVGMEGRERCPPIGNANEVDRGIMGERGWGGGGVKRSKRKSPARIAGLPPRRGELRCGVPVVWLPDFRLQPHFFSTTSRANPSQANLFISTPTDAPCKKSVTRL